MNAQEAESNYTKFSANPDRIDGAVHNTTTARLGVAFNYTAMEQIDAVEIAFANEPHGNMRSVMVVDMAAAKALRNRLDAVLAEKAANERRARRHRAKTYPVKRGDGRVVNVTIPEE